MRKRFIVLIDETTTKQNSEFLDKIEKLGFGWWHYINNSWLLVTTGNYNASTIRDIVKDIFENEHNLVIELKGKNDTWSGFGPSGEHQDMFKWLNETWSK